VAVPLLAFGLAVTGALMAWTALHFALRICVALPFLAILGRGLLELLPGIGAGALRALRTGNGAWEGALGGHWTPLQLSHSIEVLQAGWWLGFRDGRRRRWAWVDARRCDPVAYRAVARALRGAGQRWPGRRAPLRRRPP
jgi:hypothetical protein